MKSGGGSTLKSSRVLNVVVRSMLSNSIRCVGTSLRSEASGHDQNERRVGNDGG